MTYVLTIRARIAPAQRDLRLRLAWFRRVVIGYVEFGVDKWFEIWDTYAGTTLEISLVCRMVLATQGNPYPWMVGLAHRAPYLRLSDLDWPVPSPGLGANREGLKLRKQRAVWSCSIGGGRASSVVP